MFRKLFVFLTVLALLGASFALAQDEDFDWRRFEGAQITVLIAEHPVTDGMRAVLDEFTEATGISVELSPLAEDLYFDRMELALRAPSGVADVYFLPMDSTAFTQWAADLITPLTPFLEDPTMTTADYDFTDFPQGFVQATQYPPGSPDAQDYGIPVSFESYILFYNQEIVDEYLGGELPSTMDELIEAAKMITEESGGTIAGAVMRGIRSHTIMDTVTGLVFNTWGDDVMELPYNVWFDGGWANPILTDERVWRGLYHYAGLMQAGPPNIQAIDWPDASLLFQMGRAAFFIDASLFGPGFEDPEESTVAGVTGYALLPPAVEGGESRTGHWMWGLGIPANASNPEAAWFFIQWMTSKDIEPIIGAYHGGAARLSTWESPVYTDALDPQYVEVVQESMETSRTTVVFQEGWSEYALIIVDAIQDMYTGVEPAEAVGRAQDRILALVGQ